MSGIIDEKAELLRRVREGDRVEEVYRLPTCWHRKARKEILERWPKEEYDTEIAYHWEGSECHLVVIRRER